MITESEETVQVGSEVERRLNSWNGVEESAQHVRYGTNPKGIALSRSEDETRNETDRTMSRAERNPNTDCERMRVETFTQAQE